MSAKVQPPVGYKPIEGNCPLPEKVVNKKSNEIWLIRAPKDFPETEVEKIQVDLKNGNYVSELTVGDKKYLVREGDNEAVCQLFYCYKDEKKGVLPGKPFARELIIEEAPQKELFYSAVDGAGKDLPHVEQMTGMKLRYYPPGATPVDPSSTSVSSASSAKKTKSVQKSKAEVKSSAKKEKKAKKSKK